MISDVVGTAFSVVVLIAFYVLPGWVIGHAVNLMSFRDRHFIGRILLAIPLSLSISPALCYLLARLLHRDAVWLYYGVVWFGAMLHIAVRMHRWDHIPWEEFRGKHVTAGLVLVVSCVVAGIIPLVDLQWGAMLFPSWIIDQAKHLNVAGALFRTGIPPANPSYAPEGQTFSLFYYYFWHEIPAFAGKVTPWVGLRQLTFGATIWTGIAIISTAAGYARYLSVDRRDTCPEHGRRRGFIAAALLTVSGLDILPLMAGLIWYLATGHDGYFWYSAEWWNLDGSVQSWYKTVIWAPHHVAAVVAHVTAYLLIQDATGRTRWPKVILAGIAFVSGAGMSVWVTLVAAIGYGAYAAFLSLRHRRAHFVMLFGAGAFGALMVIPFALDLLHASRLGHMSPVAFSLRTLTLLGQLVEPSGEVARNLLYLAALPVTYVVELGFPLFGAVAYWVKQRRTGQPVRREDLFLLFLSAAAVIVTGFFRSSLRNNDLGWRGILLAQFAMVYWSASLIEEVLEEHSGRWSALWRGTAGKALVILLLLGVSTTAYEAVVFRVAPIIEHMDSEVPVRALNEREASQWILDETDVTRAVYAFVPERIHRFNTYVPGQTVCTPHFAKLFGIPRGTLAVLDGELAALDEAITPSVADSILDVHRVDYYLMTREAPAWDDAEAWTSTRSPAFENATTRVYDTRASREDRTTLR